MFYLVAVILSVFTLVQPMQRALFFGQNRPAATAGCTAPTVSDRWAVYDPNTACTSGACSSGGAINFMKDLAGSNDAQEPHGGHEPVYTPAAINSLAAGDYSGGSQWMEEFAIPIPSGPMSVYAVVYYDGGTAADESILGNESSGGTFNWRFDTTGEQEILSSSVASIATSSVSYPAGWYTFEVDFNQTTGAYAFKHCSGGTCVVDASGTASVPPFFNPPNTFGGHNADSSYFTGKIAEFGYYSGYGVTGLGAWSHCKYGI